MWLFGEKNSEFAKKRPDLVDKSTPSISRILSPKTGHPICDHLELIVSGNITKSEQNWWFSYTLWSPTFSNSMSNLPLKIPTFSKSTPHFRRNFSLKHIKSTKLFNIFGSSRKLKSGSFLMKTCPTSWAPRRTVRQNHEIPFRSTFAHFLWKSWSKWSSVFSLKIIFL